MLSVPLVLLGGFVTLVGMNVRARARRERLPGEQGPEDDGARGRGPT